MHSVPLATHVHLDLTFEEHLAKRLQSQQRDVVAGCTDVRAVFLDLGLYVSSSLSESFCEGGACESLNVPPL